MARWYHKRLDLDDMVLRVSRGERLAVARALRLVDDRPAVGRVLAQRLFAVKGDAYVLGVTGNPGAGKSTVVDALLETLRASGLKVAVLAVDPSSPYSGGAILGDRIRMNRHYADDGVFIRSLATRGHLGGLSQATLDSVRVCDAAGFDVVIVETVGVGQDEVDVARMAHSTAVVMVPGLGDDVQAIKAGLLEIADIFVINKADRDGAPQVERSLRQMMSLSSAPHGAWEPLIVRTVATRNEGIDKLWQGLTSHRAFLASPEGAERRRMRHREMFDRLLDAALVEQGRDRLKLEVAQAHQRLDQEHADPYAEVLKLIERQT